jgi:hypothetical protein
MADVIKLRLGHPEKTVLLALANYCDAEGGSCFPSVARLAFDCGISEQTVRRALKSLRDYSGYISFKPSAGRNSTRYQIATEMISNLIRNGSNPTKVEGSAETQPYHGGSPTLPPWMPNPTMVAPYPINEPTKEPTNMAPPSALPDWVPVEAWDSWRKYKGKKLTPLARNLQLAKLGELRDQGHNPTTVINLAIESGWATFYAPRPQLVVGKKSQADRRAETNAAIWGARNEPEPTDITGQSERVA